MAMPHKVIVPLLDLGDCETDLVGSKARNLGILKRKRFTVPDAFCISCQAYDRHTVDIMPNTEGLDSHALKGLRQTICETAIADDTRLAIEQASLRLNASTVAVRSSATAEDLPHHSFAGQYESILTIHTLGQCLDAVKQCWASLWTERAYVYREQNGIGHHQVKMAVIVQRQVEADMAGVTFTADPISGTPSRIVIESCQGLGEALVSGQVTPEQWVFRKRNLLLVWKKQSDPPVLDRTLARKLARRARRIEQAFGGPQDIEWAIQSRRIFLLQTRPVTTRPKAKPWEDRQIWTNCNLAEVVPDVTTPFTGSLLNWMLDRLFRSVLELFGADSRKQPITDLVAGRLYFNLNTSVAVVAPFLWLIPADFDVDALMGGFQFEGNHFDIPDEDIPDMGFNWLRYVLSWPRLGYNLIRHSPGLGTALSRFHGMH